MRFLTLFTMAMMLSVPVAHSSERYDYIGSFTSSNPFNHSRETLRVDRWGQFRGVIFELDSGANNVDINDVQIECRRGRICQRLRGGYLAQGQSLQLYFRSYLNIESIRVRSRVEGFPPSRVHVYLIR